MDLQMGNYIGEYRVVRLIGRGSMGTVYLCENPRIKSRVAIKVLHRRHTGSEWVVDRFISEAQVVNQIGHPGIVRIFDCRMDPEVGPYLVMEYLEGENVKERHLENLPMKSEGAVRILLQAASALSACHRAGVVHRDLKPANLFLCNDPDMPGGRRIKLLDFGVAKLIDCNIDPRVETVAGMLPGSPPYMSPEGMVDAKTIDARSDIYALGVIGYQLLTGQYPHTGGSLGRLILSRQEDEPIPPSQLNPAIHPAVEVVLMTALARDPERRYQTVDLFKQELCAASDAAARTAAVRDRAAMARATERDMVVELLPAVVEEDGATVVDLGPPEMESASRAIPVQPEQIVHALEVVQPQPRPGPQLQVQPRAQPVGDALRPAPQPVGDALRPAPQPQLQLQPEPQFALPPPGDARSRPPRRGTGWSAALIGAAATLLLSAMLIGSYAFL